LITTYYSGDQIKTNEMGGAQSTFGGDVHAGFRWGNLRERSHLEDSSVNGTIILSWNFRVGMGGHGLD